MINNQDYWQDYVDRDNQASYDDITNSQKTRRYEPEDYQDAEYVHMQLPNGESVKFKRVWGNHRFTDTELSYLMAGMEIRINTPTTKGIVGSLEWQAYKGRDYFGFAPWDAEAYAIDNAPMPVQWNGHVFTPDEEAVLRSGNKLLLVCTSNRTGSQYAVNVSYSIISDSRNSRWGIVPHFEEFDMPADQFTRETCVFMPMFGGKLLHLDEIQELRQGRSIYFEGVSRTGRKYSCRLSLVLDRERNRWKLEPNF